MAPGADIILYEGATPDTGTVADTIAKMVDDNLADTASQSWGACDLLLKGIPAVEAQLMQAAAQGISVSAAAGDNGASDGCPGKSNADFPSSSPYVLAANGTVLTISDTSGTYDSETVWFGTGGGDSSLYPQPSWQTGPGVPDSGDRMNGDMAMHAGGRGLMFYVGGAWDTGHIGTSFVSPEFAGLFALADALYGGRVGQSSELVYSDVNAGHYTSDFRDVTTGGNGHPAGLNWDYPTGWGSPKATSFLSHIGVQGPKGTLAGTVTAAANGSAISGVSVIATGPSTSSLGFRTITGPDGGFSKVLPVGQYSVEASHYGYKSVTTSVSISDGETTTTDFSLQPARKVTLSGKVTDGSGHGYGLLANIKISASGVGLVDELWTDPKDGSYSVKLPVNENYRLSVAAAFDGYKTVSKTLTLSADKTRNFSLDVTNTCSASGYKFVIGGLSEDFNEGSFPPAGWTVTNPDDGNVVWKLTSQLPSNNLASNNWTGGTGDAASADSNILNSPLNGGTTLPYDTSLMTPPIPVTSLHGASVLKYKANYAAKRDAFDLDIRANNGSWQNILHWTTTHGAFYAFPGVNVKVHLAPYLPENGTFKLRWRYYDPNADWNRNVQIDDVSIGTCVALPGGIIYGGVSSANEHNGIREARVLDDTRASTETISNNFDPELPDGFYMYFAQKGERNLTVSRPPYYAPAEKTVDVANNAVIRQDFELQSPRLEVSPHSLTVHVSVGSPGTASFALSNTGEAAAQFNVIGINSPLLGASASSVPVRLIPAPDPNWMNNSLFGTKSYANWINNKLFPHNEMSASTIWPRSAPWIDVANYPIKVSGNAMAYDRQTGKIYSVSGINSDGYVAPAFVYDTGSNAWTDIASPPFGRQSPEAEFIDGKLYLVGGLRANGDSPFPKNAAEVDIYDPSTGSWSMSETPMPRPVYDAPSVVLNGKMYVIGGLYTRIIFAFLTDKVQVYDPATDSWSTAANYPKHVFAEACGVIDGKIYCAGGGATVGEYTSGYVYDPSTDEWSPIADLDIPGGVYGSFYTAANGKLLLAGGYVGWTLTTSRSVTNQVEAYDPTTDSWHSLANLNNPVGGGAGTCGPDGFYNAGGIIGETDSSTMYTNKVQKLPGYGCNAGGHIPWLTTISPPQGTLAQGASARVALGFDSSEQKIDTTSKAYLEITGAPQNAIMPITVHWDPQPADLDVSGTVSPTGTVDAGDNLTYNITVQNLPDAKEHATQVKLDYEIPDGVNYLASSGATCATAGSAPPPTTSGVGGAIPAMVQGPATLNCDLGTINPNNGKLVTIAVQSTTAADSVSATFTVSAHEPQQGSGNTSLTLDTNPAVGPTGPTGPTGPQGPKGDKGSGGLGLLGLVVLTLFTGALAFETRRRKKAQK